jgi:hypothetical protein
MIRFGQFNHAFSICRMTIIALSCFHLAEHECKHVLNIKMQKAQLRRYAAAACKYVRSF